MGVGVLWCSVVGVGVGEVCFPLLLLPALVVVVVVVVVLAQQEA